MYKSLFFIKISTALVVIIFMMFSVAHADELKVWTDICDGEFANRQYVEIKSNDQNAKIYWTFFPKGSPDVGRIYEQPIDVNFSRKIYFFGFTSHDYSTPFHICHYRIESREESNFLRILNVNPLTNRITLKNWSKFPIDLQDWRIVTGVNEVIFPSMVLQSGQIPDVGTEMARLGDDLYLYSPKGLAKDFVRFPILKKGEIWQRNDIGSAYSQFVISPSG